MSGLEMFLCLAWTCSCVWLGDVLVSGLEMFLCLAWTCSCVWLGDVPVSGLEMLLCWLVWGEVGRLALIVRHMYVLILSCGKSQWRRP